MQCFRGHYKCNVFNTSFDLCFEKKLIILKSKWNVNMSKLHMEVREHELYTIRLCIFIEFYSHSSTVFVIAK